jgi:hypothetical protein
MPHRQWHLASCRLHEVQRGHDGLTLDGRWHEHKLTREHDAGEQAILEANDWRVLRIDE